MNNLRRELELLLLLTENKDYSVQMLAERLDITRRQLYYDLENLRACGFKLVKTNTKYRLDRHSPFFKRLHENIALTEEEAMMVYRLLDRLPHTDYLSKNIQAKLERFFNLELLTDVGQRRQAESNAAVLREAIQLRRVVILKNYSSPHSRTVSDRMVEPFLFLNAEMDIRKLAIILNNYHFDFILFDACFMASIEVFYELRNTTDYIIASPTEVLATGFPYKDILTDMLSATVNYKKIAQKYVAFFQQKKGVLQSASVVTVKTAELPQFATLFKYYLNTISREITDQKWLQYSQDEVDYLFDLGQVADYLQKEQTNKELTEQLGRLITNYHHTSYFFGKIPLQKSSGISIYIPQSATLQNDEYEFYKTLSWTNAVNMPIFTKH